MGVTTHGHIQTIFGKKVKSKTYTCWLNMKARCNRNDGSEAYKNYGGRGIKVCERWESFENFLADMGAVPSNTQLDRIDNDEDYTPENCHWSDHFTQAQNKRVKGVGFDKGCGRWRARVRRFNITHFIGNYATEEEAIAARQHFLETL